ncbi:MAG: hypothetical protein ACMXYE_01775 [Candidatus Woesearchaeota archaeon]
MTKEIMKFNNFESGRKGAREVLRSTDDPVESINRLLELVGINRENITKKMRNNEGIPSYSVYEPGVGYMRNGD